MTNGIAPTKPQIGDSFSNRKGEFFTFTPNGWEFFRTPEVIRIMEDK